MLAKSAVVLFVALIITLVAFASSAEGRQQNLSSAVPIVIVAAIIVVAIYFLAQRRSESQDYKSGHGRAQWATILLAAGVLIDVLIVASLFSQADLLSRIMAGFTVTEAEAIANDDRLNNLAAVQTFVFLGSAAAFLMWLDRARRNLPAFGARDLKYSPAWVLFGFVVPILSLFVPYQVVAEVWRASDPSANTASPPSRGRLPVTPIIGWWWALWLIANIVARFVSTIIQEAETLDQLMSSTQGVIISEVLRMAAAMLAILVVKAVDARQEEKSQQLVLLDGSPEPAPNSIAAHQAALTSSLDWTTASAEEHYRRGVVCYDTDDYDQAIAELNSALHLRPDYAEALFYRGLALYCKEAHGPAIADLDKASALDPHNAEIHFWRGQVFADMGDRAKAIFALENAIRLDLEPELRKEADSLLEHLKRQL